MRPIIGLVFLFVLTSILSYGYFTYQKVVVTAATPTLPQTLEPTPTPDPFRPTNILLLGHGNPGHPGGEITDTIILAHVNPRSQEIVLITIPRDLWVKLRLDESVSLERKVNHAYAIGNNDRDYQKSERYSGRAGGINLAKDTLSTITGLKIDYVVAVNFSAFEQMIDQLGGVEVQVPVSFIDDFYPIVGEEDNPCDYSEEDIAAMTATMSGFVLESQFTCRYQRLEFTKGPQTMDGSTALKFVRSRHSSSHGNDFNRSLRQQAVIDAIRTKLTSVFTLPKLIPLVNTLSDSVRTDINLSSVVELGQMYTDWTSYRLRGINLSTDNVLIEGRSQDRQYILMPKTGDQDWDSIQQYIIQQLVPESLGTQ